MDTSIDPLSAPHPICEPSGRDAGDLPLDRDINFNVSPWKWASLEAIRR